jgi:hypothetical protein
VTGAIATTIGGLGVSLIALDIDATGHRWGVGYDNGILDPLQWLGHGK